MAKKVKDKSVKQLLQDEIYTRYLKSRDSLSTKSSLGEVQKFEKFVLMRNKNLDDLLIEEFKKRYADELDEIMSGKYLSEIQTIKDSMARLRIDYQKKLQKCKELDEGIKSREIFLESLEGKLEKKLAEPKTVVDTESDEISVPDLSLEHKDGELEIHMSK